jgi:EVE domain
LNTWIFQGNPKRFDIDGYLNQAIEEIRWTVAQHSNEIAVGDTVFIWKAQGGDRDNSGIVAECQVLDKPRRQDDDPASLRFWKNEEDPTTAKVRVQLKLLRVATKREVLKRDWLQQDRILQTLLILRRPVGTNFPVENVEAQRLRVLWSKVGQDWPRDEVVAALCLYASLWNKPISKTTGSPVEVLAQQIGRVPTGVYNKLMNFRALDPRAAQKGLDGSSQVDRAAWNEFFDNSNNTLDARGLTLEYERLWKSVKAPEAIRETLEEKARRLEQKSLEDLLLSYFKRRSHIRPSRRAAQQLIYDRNPLVIAITRLRARLSCEVQG